MIHLDPDGNVILPKSEKTKARTICNCPHIDAIWSSSPKASAGYHEAWGRGDKEKGLVAVLEVT